jgi:hypothetical protein
MASKSTKAALTYCGPNNSFQTWTNRIRNTSQIVNAGNGLCLDDGGATFGGEMSVVACDPNNLNQHFEVVPINTRKQSLQKDDSIINCFDPQGNQAFAEELNLSRKRFHF